MSEVGRVRSALEVSLGKAAHRLDAEGEDAALICLARELADQVDYLRGHAWLNQSGKFDNVSVSQLNRCLVELGLTPIARALLREPTAAEDLLRLLRAERRT